MSEIIIDGVNVEDCRHLSFVEEDYCCDCQYEKYALCQNSDCYYKQLKRLQAENEELKHRCEIYHQCDEMIKNTYGQAHKKAMRLTKENELIKRLLNDILRIFNLGQYDFLKDQNEIIMALERAIQRDKDFFEFVELRQENELLNEKVETLDKMTGIYSARLCKKYKQALEETREICKCSKEMNCEECSQCYDCEELCTSDENLQDILIDKINKVLESEEGCIK